MYSLYLNSINLKTTMNLTTEHETIFTDEHVFQQRLRQLDETGTEASHGVVTEREASFDGKYVKMLVFGGIGTTMHFRRHGCVRRYFDELLPQARERGCAFGLLHPFAFSYYNKFGFERVSDTIICDFPITALSFIPRNSSLVPYDESRLDDLLTAYNTFALKRNLMTYRYKSGHFLRNPKWLLYLDYDENGRPAGYVTIEIENHYDNINRMVSDNLHVWELAFDSQASLLRLLGFLRMAEGQLETVHMHDIGLSPEVDLTLRNYMQMRYDIHPDIMARVLDTEAAFQAMSWPEQAGQFSLKINDPLPDVTGTFRIAYGNGSCTVERLSDGTPVDLEVSGQALVRLMMGSDAYDADTVTYLPGVKFNGNAESIFRAFPKHCTGAFEHF